MKSSSFFIGLLLANTVLAFDGKGGLSLWDNPDRIFNPSSRGSLFVETELSQKFKSKHGRNFLQLRPVIDLKYDTNLNRMRQSNASIYTLLLRPLNRENILGLGVLAGYGHSFKEEFNVQTDRHQELIQDFYQVEAQGILEKKLNNYLSSTTSLFFRGEDHKKSYSIYVNEEGDYLGGSFREELLVKIKTFDFKTSLDLNRKYYRERRALSKEGFFVNPGEELIPDVIDFLNLAEKATVTHGPHKLSLLAQYSNVEDRINGGRTYKGHGFGSEYNFLSGPYKLDTTLLWQEKNYTHQLRTFQFGNSGGEKLNEENLALKTRLEKNFGSGSAPLILALNYIYEKNISTQKDTKERKIGTYKTQMISFDLSTTF